MSKLDHFMIGVVQQLARLDEKLIQKSKEHHPASEIKPGTLEDFDHFLTLSYLWVLGAYEIIRTISQRAKENSEIFSEKTINKINETKKLFERIRIPLAKLEPAKAHKDTDSSIAFPRNSANGIGWHIAPDTYILRIQLSDALLETLKLMKKGKLKS